jgi:Plasmid stabilization system protein
MKVRFTESALEDIHAIREFLLSNYPSIVALVERQIRTVTDRISVWPESSPRVMDFPEVRATPLGRYPYRVFYKVTDEAVEIVHIHHTSRQPFWETES